MSWPTSRECLSDRSDRIDPVRSRVDLAIVETDCFTRLDPSGWDGGPGAIPQVGENGYPRVSAFIHLVVAPPLQLRETGRCPPWPDSQLRASWHRTFSPWSRVGGRPGRAESLPVSFLARGRPGIGYPPPKRYPAAEGGTAAEWSVKTIGGRRPPPCGAIAPHHGRSPCSTPRRLAALVPGGQGTAGYSRAVGALAGEREARRGQSPLPHPGHQPVEGGGGKPAPALAAEQTLFTGRGTRLYPEILRRGQSVWISSLEVLPVWPLHL